MLNENSDLQVDDKGKIDLGGQLKLTAGFGENGKFLLNMMLHMLTICLIHGQLSILSTLATDLNFLPMLLTIILFIFKMLHSDVG